jgi:diaminohydroxyphosphoribosylaminopyrimidine deaminase/5-amino-6-(5-phosphoribosylamino)uracil reductase
VPTFSKNDTQMMAFALQLAKQGLHGVKGNPMVGCVITRDQKVVATGYHQQFGKNHAEINALKEISFNAKNCTLYLTLEPCSHTGKTPPCVNSIIQAQPKCVIIASLDNNPKVNSIQKMKQAGIEVKTGLLEKPAQKLNRGFFKRMRTKMPFITCKIACSLDGKTSLKSGESKWITSEQSRADVQKLRAKNQVIITGSNTVLIDNPYLNVRDQSLPSPLKVIMDRRARIANKNLNIFQGEPVKISQETPEQTLLNLGNQEINNALIEAGASLSASFLMAGLVDELIIYQAPIIMGATANSMLALDVHSMLNTIKLNIVDIRPIGKDIRMTLTL